MSGRASRHRALARELLTGIEDGTFPVGSRLPTEPELARTHGMARETVRKALTQLEALGLIDRRPGTGTTVIATKPVEAYEPVARNAGDVLALAERTRIDRPETGEVVADAALARRLGTRAGTTWHFLSGPRSLRAAPDEPVCFSEHFLRSDLDRDSMVRGGGPDPAYTRRFKVEQTVSAGLLAPEVARVLGAQPGTPALVIARRVRDRNGRLLNVGIHTHPADRYEIVSILEAGDSDEATA